MYLVDTNVWLERLLGQERAEEVGEFLARTPSDSLFITDFAFHSIGVILTRLKATDALLRFVEDIFLHGSVNLISLAPTETPQVVQTISAYELDFDDAYQLTAAKKAGLTIVSLDRDLIRLRVGVKTPAQAT